MASWKRSANDYREELAKELSARTSAVWESWKSKTTPVAPRKLSMRYSYTRDEFSAAWRLRIGIHRNNVPPLIYKLNKAGMLIDKNGTKYSLNKLG